jgi:predicted alpha/beta-fold hydrolase
MWAARYAQVVRSRPTITCNEHDDRMKAILGRCARLKERFFPTFWCFGAYSQMVLMLLVEHFVSGVSFRREQLTAPDGGLLALDWGEVDLPHCAALPADAPTIAVLHTITGDASNCKTFVKYAARRGWRCVVLIRRGHGSLPLTTPRFNIMGDVDDTKLMVERLHAQLPAGTYLSMAGISAGSGQCVSYIGREGAGTPVRSAVSLCPAYDINVAFARMDASRVLSQGLLKGGVRLRRTHGQAYAHAQSSSTPVHPSNARRPPRSPTGIKKTFLEPNAELLRQGSTGESFTAAVAAGSIDGFMRASTALQGAGSWEEYMAGSNPMSHFRGSAVPCLLLNAADDPVCVRENVRADLLQVRGNLPKTH